MAHSDFGIVAVMAYLGSPSGGRPASDGLPEAAQVRNSHHAGHGGPGSLWPQGQLVGGRGGDTPPPKLVLHQAMPKGAAVAATVTVTVTVAVAVHASVAEVKGQPAVGLREGLGRRGGRAGDRGARRRLGEVIHHRLVGPCPGQAVGGHPGVCRRGGAKCGHAPLPQQLQAVQGQGGAVLAGPVLGLVPSDDGAGP
jgi:hypothetical protein